MASAKRCTTNAKLQKVYILDNDAGTFSVHNNKQYRLVCQVTSGKSILIVYILGLKMYNNIGESPYCSFKTCQAGRELSEKSQSVFSCRHIELVRSSEPCAPLKAIQAAEVRWVRAG